MIFSKTPLRISFLGGGTDYPTFYRNHGGLCLGTSIDKYTFITVSKLAPFFEHKIGVYYSKVELVNDIEELQHPSVRECLRFMKIYDGVEIHIANDLPARTGLGSSSSFTVGLLNALHHFKGEQNISREKLAQESIYIEQEMIKERVGSQDQFECALGGFNLIEFGTDSKIKYSKVEMDTHRSKELKNSLILFYTGIQRYAHNILKEQIESTQLGLNDETLLKMRSLVHDGIEILKNKNVALISFGEVLHYAWELKKKCSSQISSDKIDHWYALARKAGAIGGKLLGAGGGGFLLLYSSDDSKNDIRKALPLKEVSFDFENSGTQIIFEYKK